MKQIRIGVFGVIVFVILQMQAAIAGETSFSALNFMPATDGGPYLSVYGSSTLPPRQFSSGLYFNYAHRPLKCNGCTNDDVLRHVATGNAVFAIGALDRLQVGVRVPIVFYSQYFNETTGVEDSGGAMGDMAIEPKIRLFDSMHHLIGVSVLPFITLPTGDSSRFLGNGKPTGGVKVIVDSNIADRMSLALNLGYRVRDDVTRNSITVNDEVIYALGLNARLTSKFNFKSEILGSTVATNFGKTVAQSPLEADAALHYQVSESFNVVVGGGAGLVSGVGTPHYRTMVGVTFQPTH